MERYLFAEDIEGCLRLLKEHGGMARIIAGGTDLVLDMEKRKKLPRVLVDITRIREIRGIEERGKEVWLGACVTHADCVTSPLLRRKATCLSEACLTVGSPQIRNVGTLAGNIVNAQPAADAVIALVALGATVEIVKPNARREEKIEALYSGVGRSTIDSTQELITRVHFIAAGEGEGTSFVRFAPRSLLALPMLNGAVRVKLEGDLIKDVAIALGPVSDRPFRALKAEQRLKGRKWTEEKNVDEAAQLASEEASPRDSLLRGSGAYRKELVKIALKRGLREAVERARGGK